MLTLLSRTITSLVRAEQRRSGARGVRGVPLDAGFLQDWHLTNLNTAFGLRSSRKLAYQPYEQNPDACGTLHRFGTIAGKGVADVTANDTPFASAARNVVGYGGADLYQFRLAATVTSIRIQVAKQNAGVISLLRGAGDRITPIVTTTGDLNRTVNFRPGTIGSIFVVIGGAQRPDGFTDYQLTVNGGQVAQPTGQLRVRVIATSSDDPNTAAGERRALNVMINGKAVSTGTEQEGSTTITPGVASVSVDPSELQDGFGNTFRVGFITVQVTRSGQIFICGPTSASGEVTFPALQGDSNPDSDFDYSVGVRIVPSNAPPIQNVEPGCTPQALP